MKTIYLAGGCFWGTEHYLKQLNGVTKTSVCYANSIIANPTYRQVCQGITEAAETVEVEYNPQVLSLGFLLDMFFLSINPVSRNQQGNDHGTQYRTGIYYTSEQDFIVAKKSLEELQKKYSDPIAIEVLPLKNYYPAEIDHQDYLVNNPQGYCHISPSLFAIAKKAKDNSLFYRKKNQEELKNQLSTVQYEVTQNNKTEAPFENEYHANEEQGIYVDITTNEPLFLSTDKFISGCGWPSFSKPIHSTSTVIRDDFSHNMVRKEVRSKIGDSHLGHVFTDGQKETGGLRYCINSAALKFIKKADMQKEGYGEYLDYLS
ncbi:MAG: peptide-methionine (R)-S-oxide reductase MsrB [Treponemataceae bacterium]